eukprot:CAMPEP_0178963188 /NCGR_PEP_ID=MMETSP0789-20121207/14862_1 /TAXON_ID=3005 /ORGANISM="Rhizosolenia setigera, Strain CCMP 1694" /LENGTH=291 /DNA_ID=CAMNT_0020647583 /DNA_START=32 /DNA_END=904 /DNA_ORIENTATION=-
MPLRKWEKDAKKLPSDFMTILPVLQALENELRDKVKENNTNKRKTESTWPIFQITWQRSRYIYDMFYRYKKISRTTYDYCIKQKIADASLIAKWKKPGYERLCSTHVINPRNYKFGTTSICRVPIYDRSEEAKTAQDPTTGCLGCASGSGGKKGPAGPRNIFGNKYGQNLAAVQIAREKRMLEVKAKKELEEKKRLEQEQNEIDDESSDNVIQAQDYQPPAKQGSADGPVQQPHVGEGDSETDDDSDEEDYGPAPVSGVWAGSKRLMEVAEKGGESSTDDDSDEDGPQPAA